MQTNTIPVQDQVNHNQSIHTEPSHCQRSEFGRNIKRLFSHYSLWLGSAVIILLLGIPLDLPVVAVSAFVFMSMFFFNKVTQRYLNKTKII